MSPRAWPRVAALVWTLTASTVMAHDTWFEAVRGGVGQPAAAAAASPVVLALGTGTRFPVFEFPIGLEQIVASGCRDAGQGGEVNGRPAPLKLVLDRPASILLRSAAAQAPGQALSCWAQLVPFEVEIEPPIVAIYLDEVQALPSVRSAWAEQQRRGVRWRESYTKHARIELGRGGRPEGPTAAVAMGMDVRLQAPARPVHVGNALVFQVLRDGAPLAGLPVELQHEDGREGTWQHTDSQGRVRGVADRPGRWLLRGTDLRLATDDPDRWVSRFVTLAFEVVR